MVIWEFRKEGFQWFDGENAVVLISAEPGRTLPDDAREFLIEIQVGNLHNLVGRRGESVQIGRAHV